MTGPHQETKTMSHYLKYFAAVYSIALILLVRIRIYGLKLGASTLSPDCFCLSKCQTFCQKRTAPTQQKRKKHTGLGINSRCYGHGLYRDICADFYASTY